ncbi:MAG: glycosyltransferase [Hyphomicrobiales bacterium]|nr:glycosyltransferase [Hyphomicrobiales bacterium]
MTSKDPSKLVAEGADGVAIVTRTKDRPQLLERAIESVLGQTHRNWVQVIVNDGGAAEPIDDLIGRTIDRYGDRILVIHNGRSLGMEAASNLGLRSTDSRLCVIHDDDDSWHPQFLEKTIAALAEEPSENCRGIVAWSERVVEDLADGAIVEKRRASFNSWLHDISLWRMLHENCFPPISFLFERGVFDEIGYFDESLEVLGDWEFNLRFLQRFDIAVLHEHLAYYHHRTNAVSGALSNSVIGGDRLHKAQRTKLVNRLLRRDLEEGRIGLGTMISLANDLEILKMRTEPKRRPRRKGPLARIGDFLKGR